MNQFKGKNVIITGGSRGIGLSIGKKLASNGSNIAILAKTDVPHPKLPGTIFTAAKEIEQLGVKVLPIKTDIRFDVQVENAIEQVVKNIGSIDILINNASAINLFNSESLPMKRYDLMQDINTRGAYLCSKTCLPYLKKSQNPHILNLSPPFNMKSKWFVNFTAYTMSKFGMSMWGGFVTPEQCRKPEIVSEAAFVILSKNSKECSGNFFIDEDVLRNEGETDFEKYAVKSGSKLFSDLYLD